MRDETKMDVYTSGVTGVEYDAGMKQLMSNKEIIVPILQMTVSEFKTCRILCSQDLSSQLSTITQTTDYSKLEKCYSIWICAEDVPKKLQNTLTEYSFSKKDIIGVADEPEEDYDLLTVIIIRLGKRNRRKRNI